jgi:dienelactone hydrolase
MTPLLLFCALAADPVPPTPEDRAREFVAAMSRGEFDAAIKEFDDAMLKALPADRLKAVWGSVTGTFGPFQEATGVRTETKGKMTLVYVTGRFGKGPLDVRVVVNDGGKVAGLQFLPPKPVVEYAWPDYAQPEAFREKEVAVGADTEWAVPGTLTMPNGSGPFPGVVLLHGSGPHDRDESIGPNKPLKDLAGGLATRGVAVLRFEKRTRHHGARLIGVKALTVKEEVLDDARAALSVLRTTPGVDPKRVFVLGHSLGAMLAPKLAALDSEIAGLVLLAAPARPLEDLIVEQVTALVEKGSDPEPVKLDKVQKIKDQAAKVKAPDLSPDTPADQLPLGQPAAYWLSVRGYEPAAVAAGLSVPVLVLHADRDIQVRAADFALWEKALAGKPHATLKRYPNLNHLFIAGEGPGTAAEYQQPGHVAAAVIDDVAAWVAEKRR